MDPCFTADEREKKETTVPRNYKKLFAEDRALREKAAAEVTSLEFLHLRNNFSIL